MKNLTLTRFQYAIRHESTNRFKVGEKVFLKSCPQHPMEVLSYNAKTVTCMWIDKENVIEFFTYPPQALLQYEFAGFIISENGTTICIN